MSTNLQDCIRNDRSAVVTIAIIAILTTISLLLVFKPFHKTEADFEIGKKKTIQQEELSVAQKNTLLPISKPSNPSKLLKKIPVIVTAYSSTPWQTDDTPYITASGTRVHEGIVANNLLPFGTKIKIPEIYGNKTFVVEDRMSWKKGYYHVDIWFPSYWQAKNFGAKRTYIEF